MTFNEIMEIKNAGRLEEARNAAQTELAANPDNLEIRRAYAWTVYEYLKKAVKTADIEMFCENIKLLPEASMPADELVFYSSVQFQIGKIIYVTYKIDKHVDVLCDCIFESIKGLPMLVSDSSYLFMFKAFHRERARWKRYGEFCEWWNLDNLPAECYQCNDNEENKSLPLAEQAYIELAKSILVSGDEVKKLSLAQKLRQLRIDYPRYKYLLYYEAKLYISLGRCHEAFVMLLPYVASKPNDAGAWLALSEASDDADMRVSCLCVAIMCKSKPEMQIVVREHLAVEFARRQMYAEASCEVMLAVGECKKNAWQVPQSFRDIVASDWFGSVAPTNGNFGFYKRNSRLARKVVTLNITEFSSFEGDIKIAAGGFGFVNEGEETAFVPAKLIQDAKLSNGQHVVIKVQKTFDTKRNRDSWSAFLIV